LLSPSFGNRVQEDFQPTTPMTNRLNLRKLGIHYGPRHLLRNYDNSGLIISNQKGERCTAIFRDRMVGQCNSQWNHL
jgi:hypothetical protein